MSRGHSMSCEFPEGCSCGASEWNWLEARATKAEQRIAELEAQLQAANREATYLANVIWNNHYRDAAPDWRPLPDTIGVISQINNMFAGMSERALKAEADLTARFTDLAAMRTSRDELAGCLEELKRNCVEVILPNAKNLSLDMGQIALWGECVKQTDAALAKHGAGLKGEE